MDYELALKNSNIRMTPIRHLILEKIYSDDAPVSAQAIQKHLKSRGRSVNKTTVYRALSLLVSERIVKEVHIISGGVRYESSLLPHHHHLNCTECGNIEEVICDNIEAEVDRLKSKIRKKGFEIQSHNLEFYGTCLACSKNSIN